MGMTTKENKMNGFNTVATMLKEARVETGISQTELAKKAGMKNGQFISNIERGLCSLPARKIQIMCDLLGLNQERLTMAITTDYEIRLRSLMNPTPS